nr:zinc finger BED domain-containing protein 5-like [Onthophagus taurus]
MKPANLRRHLQTKHEQYVTKDIDFYQNKLRDLKASQKLIEKTAFGSNNEKAVIASYQVALLIAKSGKPHTIGENLILPAVKTIVTTMLGDNAAKDFNLIAVSNDTVKKKLIIDMAENAKTQLISKIKNSQFYSLQLDESKDVADNENLLVFIRYDCEDNICEDFLFCQPLQTHSTGGEIFKCVNNFIETNNIEWTKCIGICTDGSRAMSGTVRELQGLVKDVAPNAAWTHCCIHRAALAAKGMKLLILLKVVY